MRNSGDLKVFLDSIHHLKISERMQKLRRETLAEERFVSIEQALIVTEVYKEYRNEPVIKKRAIALAETLRNIEIRIDPGELIVGNRTPGIRSGVVFPESGVSWINKEFETLPEREQDRFQVKKEDIESFRTQIYPFWQGISLEDRVYAAVGEEVASIGKVVKINQKDHAQGHICPNTEKWLTLGPRGIRQNVMAQLNQAGTEKKNFYESVIIVLDGVIAYMQRYAELAEELAGCSGEKDELLETARICRKLSEHPPETFHEALQSLWFLFVVLHMESNASSFSPGRMDQYLYTYYEHDIAAGRLTPESALELIEALWIKFNHIVYMRNSNSAKYFAGFPIGFNVAIGGRDRYGRDAANELSCLFLKAQEHIGLAQPNLSVRLFSGSDDEFIRACSRVISKGSGMPQVFNDEAVIPALKNRGISNEDAVNYAIVGCVELTTHGNNLGWSDAAMFNMVKALELTLNNGRCFLSGEQIGLDLGNLMGYKTYEELERAFEKQLNHFIGRMISCCELVERMHAEVLPSPFLSCVIEDCISKGADVTAGGAHYNLSGIQAIQPANIADSLAALKKAVFEERRISKEALLRSMQNNFEGDEKLRLFLMNEVPKYGNDVEWVDTIGYKWIKYFADELKKYTNIRGGPYHSGLYTVSAHVPMGQNVAATPDGRKAREPLADGGLSAVYGRDKSGPTALLKSVSRIDSLLGSNGTLLNMKFSPQLFHSEGGIEKFVFLLKTFVRLKIIHVQFNVVSAEDLYKAKQSPQENRSLLVRVAGYTAYFTELAADLQDEIIARTVYETI